MAEQVSGIRVLNTQMATAASEQGMVIQGVGRSVVTINQLAGRTAVDAEQTSEVSNNLTQLSNQLEALVRRFRFRARRSAWGAACRPGPGSTDWPTDPQTGVSPTPLCHRTLDREGLDRLGYECHRIRIHAAPDRSGTAPSPRFEARVKRASPGTAPHPMAHPPNNSSRPAKTWRIGRLWACRHRWRAGQVKAFCGPKRADCRNIGPNVVTQVFLISALGAVYSGHAAKSRRIATKGRRFVRFSCDGRSESRRRCSHIPVVPPRPGRSNDRTEGTRLAQALRDDSS